MSTRFAVSYIFLFSLAAGIIGCGDGIPSNVVSGTVRLNGEPVNGTIHFVGQDGKEVMSPVGPAGGAYTVMNPPLGDVTILLKPALGSVAAPPAPPGSVTGPEMPGMPKTSASVSPPAKYGEASGGLKYSVKPGKQVHDIELTP